MFKRITEFFFHPTKAFLIFTIFILIYLIYLDEEGAFSGKFLHFGPGTNEKNSTKFLNMKLDTWKKVIILYLVAFINSLIMSYYTSVILQWIQLVIWNPSVKTIKYSKPLTIFIVIMEAVLVQILFFINFFTILTQQFQFILPNILGYLIIHIPFNLFQLNKKKFI